MKKYIFYTSEGFAEDNNFEQIENCQILGWQEGKDEKDAFENFKIENPNIEFKEICCQELVNGKVYCF
jgi:hypothetical protein